MKNIYREAGKQGIIANVDSWFAYDSARNMTSHTYNEARAEEVYSTAKQFVTDAEKLLKELENRIGSNDYSWTSKVYY